MIIAHFFLRTVRKEPFLFVETTSSKGLEQPVPAAQSLIRVSYDERRQTWIKKAYYAFIKKYPHLVLIDSMENTLRLESDRPSFDLVFKPVRSGRQDIDAPGKDGLVLSVIKNLFSKKR